MCIRDRILIVAVLTFLSCVAGAVCIVACVGLSLLAILCLLAGQTVGLSLIHI